MGDNGAIRTRFWLGALDIDGGALDLDHLRATLDTAAHSIVATGGRVLGTSMCHVGGLVIVVCITYELPEQTPPKG